MIKAWGVTDKGAVRQQNQDGFYFEQYGADLTAGVVCDGMGGALAGNIASQLAVETFADQLDVLRDNPPGDPLALLSGASEAANEVVFHRACTDPGCKGMGTTMVAALVWEKTAYLLNIGDSRAYHAGEGGITKLTRDHSLVEDLVRRGDISPEQARTHPQKHLITRALGSEARVRADLYEKELRLGDFLLLCSDGLSNVVTDQELLYEILHGGPPDTCCQRLLGIALSRGAPDNVTAILLEIL